MPGAAHRLRVLGITVALLAALGACSADPPTPSGQPSSVTVPSPNASSSPQLPKDGRPLQPIPKVKPAGFTKPPPGTGLSRYVRQQLEWKPCGHGFWCSTMLVPLDYADPDGTAITLALAKRPAPGDNKLGSLIINPGGPGGSGVGYVGYFNAAGLERYDIVGWDPRGVGRSTPVTCFGRADLERYLSMDSSPDDAGEWQARIDEQMKFGQSCLRRSGPLLEHISTLETVRDLDLLRGLVGDPKINYFGSSYGTKIGALYAEMFPLRVGRMVLDGAININSKAKIDQIDGFERALHHFAAWCAGEDCRLGAERDVVLSKIKEFLGRLDQEPLAVADGRTLSQQQGVEAVFYAMYGGTNSWPDLRDSLTTAIFDGDGGRLLQLADAADRRDRDGTYGQLMYAFPAIRCLDSQENSVRAAEKRLTEDSREAPILGPLNGPDLVCPLWPVKSATPQPEIDAAGAPPIVVIGTTGDPATPYEYAKSMAKELSTAVLVTFDGEGHLAYGQNDCVKALVDGYLVRNQIPRDGTRC
ncbi:MAG TPA: alpha/beta hydrolase [Propionibacteriaceae bacterium]|jgi:pimeloyl-ACP methyl ester carboxylesterase|nr:alpha/beta hydrolase [Propionibacteriaceae bacterium]